MGEVAWKAYQRKRQYDKHAKFVKRHPEKAIFYKREVKLKLIHYKGGKCEKCGYAKNCATAYAFHHLDPSKKDFNIGTKSLSFELSKPEVDKCILVCQNCHAEIHDALYLESKYKTILKIKQSCPSGQTVRRRAATS